MGLRAKFWAAVLTVYCGCLFSISATAAPVLYSVSSNEDDQLRTVDPTSGATLSSITITLSGSTVRMANGLATNPLTGELFALLTLQGQSGRQLVKLDPATGVATGIGNTGGAFATLAFDSSGVLYGVTGENGPSPESLFTIDTATGTTTLKLALGAGDDGEAIAFNPIDGLLYHASGHDEDCTADRSDGVCFEKINLTTLVITPIDINGTALTDEEAQALVYWAAQNAFIWKQNHGTGPLFLVNADGTSSVIGDLDHQAKGLAFAAAIASTVPEPGSLALLSLGLLGLVAFRRRLALDLRRSPVALRAERALS